MAKHKSKKSRGSVRAKSNRESMREFDERTSEELEAMEEVGYSSADHPDVAMSPKLEVDAKQLLARFREFLEDHPGQATALGAVVGGVAAGIFASETGRSLMRASYSYARPMISDLARKFMAEQKSSSSAFQ